MTPSASNGSKRVRWFARMRAFVAFASLAALALDAKTPEAAGT